MKIKVGNFKIDTRTLVEFRRYKGLPRLYVHEKYEKIVKWFIAIVTILSLLIIFIVFKSYFLSVTIGLILFILSFIFSQSVIKYTTLIVQPFANFKIDYSQWVNVLTVSSPDYKKDVNLVGFVYKDMAYGIKFFDYIKSWNFGSSNDIDRNIVLSIIEEPDGAFTFYIYANHDRKNLDFTFKENETENLINRKKLGKVQEGLVMQMAYWRTVHYRDKSHMWDFLKNQPSNEMFILVPANKIDNGYSFDLDSKIVLHGYHFSKRIDLHKYATENNLDRIATQQNAID